MKRQPPHQALDSPATVRWNDTIAAALRAGIREHESLRRRCAREASGRALHQLRVESRRLLPLVTVAVAICGAETGKLEASIARDLHQTAKLRDAEVQLGIVAEMLAAFPELEELRRHLRRNLRRRVRAAVEKFGRRKSKVGGRGRMLAAALEATPETQATKRAVVRIFREVLGEATALGVAAQRDTAQLHRARLALKRLRYLAELLRAVWLGIPAAWLAQLRRRQRALGEIHDLQIFSRRLARQRRGEWDRVAAFVARRERRLTRAYQARPPVPPLLVSHPAMIPKIRN